MREGSAEMNTLLHSARFQSEIDDVLRDGVCVEEVTGIYETTSLSKPLGSVALMQRRRERACDGSPSRKTNWPVLRISALSRELIPVVNPGWRSRGRLLPRCVWYSIWSSGSLRSSGSLHFRPVRRRLPAGRRETLQSKTLSSSKPQLGHIPSKTSLIFLGLICSFDRTSASSQRMQWYR